MFCRILLVIVSLTVYIKEHQSPAEVALPEDIQTLCPYSKFCDREPLQPLPVQMGQRNKEPCCSSCSCSTDCGRHRNCCLDELDRYKIDELLGTSCKYLNTKDQYEDSRMDLFYYIVDKCPGKLDTCMSLKASDWGSYFPVFSKSTGMLYHNIHCADCHNQTDLVTFTPLLSCSFFMEPYFDMFFKVIKGVYVPGCYLEFLVPNDLDISGEMCYPDMVRTCDSTRDVNGTLQHLCSSINAPFFDGMILFGNIYCFLCTASSDIKQMCPVVRYGRVLSTGSMSILLSTSVMKTYREHLSASEEKYFCFKHGNSSITSKTCKVVHCPEGQFRLKGRCTIFGKKWFLSFVEMYVNLTLTVKPGPTISFIERLLNDELASKMIHLLRPGLQDWEIHLSYSTSVNSTTVTGFLAVLSIKSKHVRPKKTLDNIERSMKTTWKLYLNGTIVDLKASFNKHVIYNSIWMNGDIVYVPGTKEFVLDEDILVNMTAGFSTAFGERTLIGKLFFCEQIEFDPDEFVLEERTIHLTHHGKALESGEYMFASVIDGKVSKVRVCLSDVQPYSSTARTISGRLNEYFGPIVVILLLKVVLTVQNL